MSRHVNEELVSRLYQHFGKGEFADVLAMCDDAIQFHVVGHVSFSGVHTKATFSEWIGQVWSISGGTFREEIRDVTANDHHAVVLLDHYLTRDGRAIHYRVAHLWSIANGVFTRWEEWPGDEAAFDAAWGDARALAGAADSRTPRAGEGRWEDSGAPGV